MQQLIKARCSHTAELYFADFTFAANERENGCPSVAIPADRTREPLWRSIKVDALE
jgi:hypothetical protein